jgi:hypothetical protein
MKDGFAAASILKELQLSASEFGYRAQALFAETLVRLGARVENIARVGHPDVLARLDGRRLRVQVKSTTQQAFTLEIEDLDGIRPRAREEEGYLAVLDCGPPLAWICVTHARASVLLGRLVPLSMLGAMADATFSSQCTDAFVEIILEHRDSIEAYTFSLVSRRALTESR